MIDEPTRILSDRLVKEFPIPNYFCLGLDSQIHTLNEVRSLLPKGGKILDIGCGPLDKTAMLAWSGYECHAIDDFSDPWHHEDGNLGKIESFAADCGIKLRVSDGHGLNYGQDCFDLAMINDVIEHLPTSPRGLINAAINVLKPRGFLIVTVPNAVNLRKRIDVLRGRTNYPPYSQFFWSNGPWRGHIREYVRDDLVKLATYTGLDIEKLESCHHMSAKLPKLAQPAYRALTAIFPGCRDSWLLIGRKPAGWWARNDPEPGTHAFGPKFMK